MIILKMLEKLWHVNFFKFDKKNVNDQKQNKEHHRQHLKKKDWRDFFKGSIIYIFWIKLEKVYEGLTFPGFCLEKPNVLKGFLCHCEMFFFCERVYFHSKIFGGTNFGMVLCILMFMR